MIDEFSFLMVPGIGASDAAHWQSLWRDEFADACMVEPADRDRPDVDAWVAVLNRDIERCRKPVVILAHSLGCALVAHWAERILRGGIEAPSPPIASAMLVAPGDVDRKVSEIAAVRSFVPLPRLRFSFPSIVVTSTNDPYVAAERAEEFARSWGSEFVCVGAMGHISVDSGCGPWPRGMEILTEFLHRQRAPRQQPA
jgi:predicted alpha/beta hydrolase family esterase